MLVARTQTKNKRGRKPFGGKKKRKREKRGTIIPTMNHYLRNGWKGDPELPIE